MGCITPSNSSLCCISDVYVLGFICFCTSMYSRRPFEVDHFSRLDWSNRNGPFHLTISTHSQSQDLAVRYLPCTKWRKIVITALLWIVNSRCIGVTRTSMYSYHRSVACFSSKVYVLAADGSLKKIYFPREFGRFFSSFNLNVVLKLYGKYLGTVCSK